MTNPHLAANPLARLATRERTAYPVAPVRELSALQESDPFPHELPWPSHVDGAELLECLRGLITSYIVLPPSAAEAMALWVAHTYVWEAADYTPYLLVTSPVRECGKSTVLDLLLHLVHRGQLTGGISAAALYRRIDRLRPTMLLDELDTRLRAEGGQNLRNVLNTGFHRDGRMTICVGDGHGERDFRTFCPKVLAGIGALWDTVASRSIPIRLRRATREELSDLRRIRGDRIHHECAPHRRQLLRWREPLREALHVADPVVPEELGARHGDVWRPLLAIADAAGGPWPEIARSAARELHGPSDDESDEGLLLLADLREVFAEAGQPRLTSAFIAAALRKRDDRPWPEFRRNRPMSPSAIASLLKRFGVRPKNLRMGGEVQKGYDLDQLREPFRLYLPIPGNAATAATGEL